MLILGNSVPCAGRVSHTTSFAAAVPTGARVARGLTRQNAPGREAGFACSGQGRDAKLAFRRQAAEKSRGGAGETLAGRELVGRNYTGVGARSD